MAHLGEDDGLAIVESGVPPAQQTMPLDRVFWSHFSPNLGTGSWILGLLLVPAGLDFRTGMLAVVLGNLIGALPVAFAAVMGPATGLTQMETDPDPEEHDLIVRSVTVAEFETMMREGVIRDNCTLAAWGMYLLWKAKQG